MASDIKDKWIDDQILLPDNARCLSVQAFLKMCNLAFEVEVCANAENMSPSGKVPFIKVGPFVISELDPIVAFVNTKGHSLSSQLDSAQKADMRAYMSLVENVLGNAELYISWLHEQTFEEVTKPRYGSIYPWPLNNILCWKKQRNVCSLLKANSWYYKTLEEVHEEVRNCCCALSERIGNNSYFCQSRPTELDALVFGHLFTILTTPLPDNSLASMVREFDNLVLFCQQIEKRFFQNEDEA